MKRNCFEEDHNIFRESFRRFIEEEVAPNSEQWREDGIVPRNVWRKAGENGYLLTWADEKFGGLGIDDFRFEQIMIEELARVGETGFYMNLHSALVGPYIGKFANEEQKARFLPGCISGETILGIAMTEPDAGSDLAGMRSSAIDCGDHYLLNGTKTFISNGLNGDLFIVAARTDKENPHAMGLFLVERGMEGFSRGNKLKKMGMPSQDTAELFFDNVKVPKKNVLGNPIAGFKYLMSGLAEERLITASSCIATAQTAIDLTISYVNERKVFGKPLSKFQNTRFKLAEMRSQIDIAQVFVDRCVTELNSNNLSAEDASMAKLHTSELLSKVADECLQLHGGNGFMDEYLISKIYTDSRVTRIFAGTSEIMKEIIARSILDV